VFGHVSYMECGQALGNRLFFRSLDLRFSSAGTDGCLLDAEPAFPFAKRFFWETGLGFAPH
jgi:hypothetical protein